MSSEADVQDAGYCFGRPYTMEGGVLHWPLYSPYKLYIPSQPCPYDSYGEVDYIYGKKAYDNHNGFTNAQSALNVVEVIMQLWFLKLRQHPRKQNMALLVGFTVSVMTLSKTLLYWLQEYFSGYVHFLVLLTFRYAEVGHNSLERLILLWVIPNGAWILFPSILVAQFGKEIMARLENRRPIYQGKQN